MAAAVRPGVRSFSDIKSKILRPSLTSYFLVHIIEPAGTWGAFKTENNIKVSGAKGQTELNLLCNETVLPGSSLATHSITSDFTGVTEKHAYRRNFDDRIDLTFMVNADNNAYLPIKFFEGWIKYISDEKTEQGYGVPDKQYSYRMKYPEEYYGGLAITKFERNHHSGGPELTYHFVNAFPISMTSMPVSYDTSQMLKCTVSFSYIRYYVDQVSPTTPTTTQTMENDPPGPIPAIENLRNNADRKGNYVSKTKSNTSQQIDKYMNDKPTGYNSPQTGANAKRAEYM